MKKIITLLFFMALVCVKGWEQTASITWNPTTSGGDVPAITGNISGTTLSNPGSFGSSLTNKTSYNSTSGINATNWSTNGYYSSSSYIQFVVSPNGGYNFNVSSTVNALSKAAFTTSAYSTCTNTNVTLTINGTANTTVSYQIGNSGTPYPTTPLGSDGTGTIITNNLQSGANTYTLKTVTAGSNTCAVSVNSTATINAQLTPTVSAITVPGGGAYVQTGSTLQLSDTPPANATGAWTSSTAQSTVDNTGLVSGVTAGTPTITYTVTATTGSLHCTNSATQVVRVYNPDYVTKNTIVNFSDNSNWQVNRGDNTYVNAPSYPSGSNYTSITVQNPLTLDVDFQLAAGKTFTIATGGTMTILPNKTFSSLGTVDFGNNSVTVKSDATGTGAIGTMATQIANATKVTAERYIGSAAYSTGRRAWRLITAPVTGVTINQAWQEGAVSSANTPVNPTTGYGTLITGNQQGTASNAAANGYDFWPAIAGTYSSLRYYVPGGSTNSNGTWATYPSIKNLPINTQPAYMLFVQGDRTSWNTTASNYASTVGITTLRATGILNQGTQTINVPKGGANSYTLVGNPYASTIDFEKIYTNSGTTGISPYFLVWNSQNEAYGAYTLVQRTGTNTYTVTPNTLSSGTGNTLAMAQYIVSGQGFFVQPSSATTDGNLVIADNAKVSASTAAINPYRLVDTDKKLYVNLNLPTSDSTSLLADGIMERYDASYSAAIDGDDVVKQANFNENLAIESHATDLIVEARPDIKKTDTVQLKLWNVSARTYQLQVKGNNFAGAAAQGLHAYVEDSYLKTREEVSLTGSISTINFTVNSDAASYDSHRFRIVFQNEATVLPLTLTSVKAAQQNAGVQVSWTVQNEENIKQYGVERSTDGITFNSIANQTAKNLAGAGMSSYASFDAAPHKGDNFYRIRVEARDGKVTYSNVVKVTVGEDGGRTLITLYPNPVSRSQGKSTLTLKNVKAGDYLLSVYSVSGQAVVEKKIVVAVGTGVQTETLSIASLLAQGSYELRLADHNGIVIFTGHLIVGK